MSDFPLISIDVWSFTSDGSGEWFSWPWGRCLLLLVRLFLQTPLTSVITSGDVRTYLTCRHLDTGLCERNTISSVKSEVESDLTKDIQQIHSRVKNRAPVLFLGQSCSRSHLSHTPAGLRTKKLWKQKRAKGHIRFGDHGALWRNPGNIIRKCLAAWSLLFCIHHWSGSNLTCFDVKEKVELRENWISVVISTFNFFSLWLIFVTCLVMKIIGQLLLIWISWIFIYCLQLD